MSRSGISGIAGISKGKLQSSPSKISKRDGENTLISINQSIPVVVEVLMLSIGS